MICSLVQLFSKSISKERMVDIMKDIVALKEKTMGERILKTFDNYRKSKDEELFIAGLFIGKMIAFNDIGIDTESLKSSYKKSRNDNDRLRYIG